MTTAPPDGVSVLTSDRTRSTVVTNENLVTKRICIDRKSKRVEDHFFQMFVVCFWLAFARMLLIV